MKQFVQSLREIAVALVVLLAVGALITAVVKPAFFAARMAGIFRAMEDEGFDVKLTTPIGEASFERVKSLQFQRSDAEILDLRARLDAARAENAALSAQLDAAATPGIAVEPPPAAVVEHAQPRFVVLAGAEKDLESQRVELRRLQNNGFPDAVILKSGDWYQSSVIFETRSTAETGLRDISEVVGVNRGAYIRALPVYCPDMTPIEGEPDVFDCA